MLPALPNPITRGKGQATTTWFEATALSAKFPVSLAIAHTFLAQFFLVKACLPQLPAPSSSIGVSRRWWPVAFRAEDDDEARAIIDDEEGSMRSDLKVLVGMDGEPLWDGESAIEVREATVAQHAEWKQSRDQAISDGEIDLDAGNVYLIKDFGNEHISAQNSPRSRLAPGFSERSR